MENKHMNISPAKNSVQFHLERVATYWYKTAENILMTAKMLLDAENDLSVHDYREFRKQLSIQGIMSPSTVSKLRQISKNAILNNSDYLQKLPQSYESLYILTTQDDNLVEDKIIKNEITAKSDRKDIIALFKLRGEVVEDAVLDKESKKTLKISIKESDLNSEKIALILIELKKLQELGLIDISGDI